MGCGDLRFIMNELRNLKESPVWVADVDDEGKSRMSLWVSKENNTWTILQYNQKIGCIIDSGTKNVFSAEFFGGKGV